MSGVGTKLPFRDVHCPVANGGRPDMAGRAHFVETDPNQISGLGRQSAQYAESRQDRQAQAR
jgi:hypothetical protein